MTGLTPAQRLRDHTASLLPVLDDIDLAMSKPDHWGGRWQEVYLGSAVEGLYVIVDFVGNAVHVAVPMGGDPLQNATVTYLPSWFGTVLRLIHERDQLEPVTVTAVDVLFAHPIRFRVTVKRDALEQSAERGLRALPFVYDTRPSRAAFLTSDGVEADGGPTITSVHWSAPAFRLLAAPGVEIAAVPLLDEWDMVEARRTFGQQASSSADLDLSSQALSLSIERLQDPLAVPPLGARWMDVPGGELDLGASVARMEGSGPKYIEVTRPDGVDLVFLTPEAVDALNAGTTQFIAYMQLYLQGLLPDSLGVSVRIRVDAMSADDRFAYSVTYLGDDGEPTTAPLVSLFAFEAKPPYFRLSVVRTAKVQVFADMILSGAGEALDEMIQYREAIRDFDSVPAAIVENDDFGDLVSKRLPCKQLDLVTIFDVAITLIGVFPPTSFIADAYDLATLMTYLFFDGKDPLGRPMTPLEFNLTLCGLLLPLASGPALRQANKLDRIVRIGDAPGARMAASLDGVDTARDLPLAAAFVPVGTP